MDERTEALEKIKEEVTALKESPLFDERVKNGYLPVIGEGDLQAEIMFVGEAPGENEAKSGKPFCGRAGKLLDKLLESVGIERECLYHKYSQRPPAGEPRPFAGRDRALCSVPRPSDRDHKAEGGSYSRQIFYAICDEPVWPRARERAYKRQPRQGLRDRVRRKKI